MLLLEALLTLAGSSLAVAILPFKRSIRAGSIPVASSATSTDHVIWAVELVARRVPWRTVCLQKGLAAQRMFRRRGHDARLHYGIGHDVREGALAAHVWVTLDGRDLIGGEEADRFAPVAVYP